MNLHDLNVFATAARFGSISKAAKWLATVQSNVTGRVRPGPGRLVSRDPHLAGVDELGLAHVIHDLRGVAAAAPRSLSQLRRR